MVLAKEFAIVGEDIWIIAGGCPSFKADFAFIKAWKGDTHGNLIYRSTARNFNPMMATAGSNTFSGWSRTATASAFDCKRKQGYISGPLYRSSQLSLMFSTVSRNSGRNNFPPLRNKRLKKLNIIKINIDSFLNTKPANLLRKKRFFSSASRRYFISWAPSSRHFISWLL